MKDVLIVDDDTEFTGIFTRIVEHLGHNAYACQNVQEAVELLTHANFAHIFLDFMLPDGSGLHIYEKLITLSNTPKVTFITGNPAVKKAISQVTGPNTQFLLKPITKEDIERAIADKPHVKQGKHNIEVHFGCLVGESQPMQEMYQMIKRVANTQANVLLSGESGVGKELVAQAIHYASNSQGELISTNCGGLSKELISSELFGHEKGAFTGAIGQKIGVFERANGGSLFLDEVTEMPLDMQPSLLRVLETHKVTRVGGTKEVATDCRVISATNRDAASLASGQVLRPDIYFRLAVFPIDIPPLKARKEDITLLATYFLAQFNEEYHQDFAIKPAQLETLKAYDWPGNVRELRHAIHRAFIMSDPDATYLDIALDMHSPFAQSAKSRSDAELAIAPGKTIEDVEKALIYATLAEVNGNKSAAADMLGISTKTLYNRLHAYGDMSTV